MLVLIPSRNIVKVTKIDFDLLNYIFNRFISIKNNTYIKVEKSRTSWSAYWQDEKMIRVDLTQGTTLKCIVSTLLHEIRHVKQIIEIKDISFDYANYNEYYNSPEEKDARKFEKLASDVCNIYKSFKKIEDKYYKYNFNSLKELSDNVKK